MENRKVKLFFVVSILFTSLFCLLENNDFFINCIFINDRLLNT